MPKAQTPQGLAALPPALSVVGECGPIAMVVPATATRGRVGSAAPPESAADHTFGIGSASGCLKDQTSRERTSSRPGFQAIWRPHLLLP